jgi:hypothetical protein
MTYLIDVPVDSGGRLLVEVADDGLGSLELASLRPGEVVARARVSLEHSLEDLLPSLAAVTERLRRLAPDECTVEFGLACGVESGLFVAKGTGNVHLTVALVWRKGESGEVSGG